ncbi:MAG: hypothetical protein QM765_31125 [Myxococcales bacterium]
MFQPFQRCQVRALGLTSRAMNVAMATHSMKPGGPQAREPNFGTLSVETIDSPTNAVPKATSQSGRLSRTITIDRM